MKPKDDSPAPAVETRSLVKRFGETAAVDGISLRIEHGELFSILGSSGCGKTTTLRLIAGFESPDEGSVLLHGEDITALPAHLRKLGMVFQSYALFPHLTVFENVAFPLRIRKMGRTEIEQRVHAALGMVRLWDLGGRKPAELSGGQQQRVAVARALVFRPTVVLLDEPLGALDLKLRKAMQLELKALQRDVGITFIHVTHDQEEALTLSDRLAVLDQGKVVQVGDPRTLYERPATRFVADFIGVSSFLSGSVRSISSTEVAIEIPISGVVLAPPSEGLIEGQEVTVAIRPERMRIERAASAGEGGGNAVEGRLEQVLFMGAETQYIVDVGPAGRLTVRAMNDRHGGSPALEPGERVRVRWDVASTACFFHKL